jgi:hypothetical protein
MHKRQQCCSTISGGVIAFCCLLGALGSALDWSLCCRLTNKLLEVCKNPVFAGFNHYLFESAAALIVATRGDEATLQSLEGRLCKVFDLVLQHDGQEFHPYVFQIFALIIDSSPSLRPQYLDVRPLSSLLFQSIEPKLTVAFAMCRNRMLATCVTAPLVARLQFQTCMCAFLFISQD